jgi:hypothetical protein
MIDEQVFNTKISELENLKGSNVSQTIELIRKTNKHSSNYYLILDAFVTKLGLGFVNSVMIDKNDKIIGYIPQLTFHPRNVFNEIEPVKEFSYVAMDVKSSSKLLAKEVIYQIMRFDDLENFIEC